MKKLKDLDIYVPDGDTHFGAPDPKKKRRSVAFEYQKDRLDEAYRHVRNFGVAVDVGAHVGLFARAMAERFERVICFEACRENFECLEVNTQHLPNVERHFLALGQRPGLVVLDKPTPGNSGNHQVVVLPSGNPPHAVEMRTLDSFDLPALDLLKIDVQGFEFFVIRGAKRLIKAHRPVVICECEGRNKLKRDYGLPYAAAAQEVLRMGARTARTLCEDFILVFDPPEEAAQ